jgi:hypothetical protein
MIDAGTEDRLGWFDLALVAIFMIGLYTGYTLQISSHIPMPSAPSGVAGVILLWRRRNDITPTHLAMLLAVIAVYIGSILSATNYTYLPKRFTGLVQLTYSLVIGYALFLTLVRAERRQLALLFLGFCVFILIGCLLEDYTRFRSISDRVRQIIYRTDIYEADLRDQLLYGRIRPKLFTSEPSAVTFAYTLFGFMWLLVSTWRWKLLGYLAMMGVGLFAMPGPTLLLMLVLVAPYELFLRPSGVRHSPSVRLLKAGLLSAILIVGAVVVGTSIFSERYKEVRNGGDPSFFYRETGPALTALHVIEKYPWAGAGLTGEEFIANDVLSVYANSAEFSSAWKIPRIAEVLTNYFWLHWIYLGLIWGVIALIALSVWLKLLGAPSLLFCWAMWTILGQAAGAYVGPRTWAVLLLAAAGAVLAERAPGRQAAPASAPLGPPAVFPPLRLAEPGRRAMPLRRVW